MADGKAYQAGSYGKVFYESDKPYRRIKILSGSGSYVDPPYCRGHLVGDESIFTINKNASPGSNARNPYPTFQYAPIVGIEYELCIKWMGKIVCRAYYST